MEESFVSSKSWYKLDNSAKIIPSMTNKNNTNVFRLYCVLKKDVDKDILDLALKEALEEYPLFTYTMKSGLFWHYLEPSNIKPRVEEEKDYPCAKIDDGLLFRVSYYKKRINLEVYHVLADGNGAMCFLKEIVSRYLDRAYKLKSIPTSPASEYEKASDDFKKFDRASLKIKMSKKKRAYKFRYPRKDNVHHDVIEVHVKLAKLKEIAQKYDATITVLLGSILIKSIAICAKERELTRPIGLVVPVDLRGVFHSRTTRNFFYAICLQYRAQKENDLASIVESLKSDIKENMEKENLQELLNSYMLFEKFLFIRIVPTFLKDFILNIVSKIVGRHETMTLSNMGIIDMPKQYSKYIIAFGGMMSSNDIHLTAMSYKDEVVLNFTTHFKSNEIERTFVSILQYLGIGEVEIVSNKEESDD